MSDGKITITDNGPYVIEMPAEIVDSQGKSWSDDTKRKIILCRCGQSENKPYCDGTHRSINFESNISGS